MGKPLENIRILVAEDNPTNQIVVSKMIEQLGGSCQIAGDGVEAIGIFDPKKFDLALLDIEMPRKNGLEVIQHIRSREDTSKSFPIVALTAFVMSAHRAKIRNAGANGILAKPIVDMDKFGIELASYLDIDAMRKGADAPKGEDEDFTTTAIDELRASLGDAVMPELISGISVDLARIKTTLIELMQSKKAHAQGGPNVAAEHETALKKEAHALVSVAHLAGARRLGGLSKKVMNREEPIGVDEFDALIDEFHVELDAAINHVDAITSN